ncbi:MAG: pyrroloquinoline quinone biosynthesis protein PqqB [Proteobacteria bacterium]|nr:pyrroloquinoline quinone biosynthesis protein PqqB [Pseudomonadota bacterium]
MANSGDSIELIVLGTAQDGGAPQMGHNEDPAWRNASLKRTATCLGVVDRASGRRWMFDATPDIRDQLYRFDSVAPPAGSVLDGIFLTHAHMGHYTGLMFFGRESMGVRNLPVHAMPRMAAYLSNNGPWSQLVRLGNIALKPLTDGKPIALGRVTVTPFLVPHREEFSEVVGFRIDGPSRKVLFIPDIDHWEDWDVRGVRIEDEIAKVDVAYLDGTFHADDELPGRDISKVPHPTIVSSMRRFGSLAQSEKSKIRFIHLNWSNPVRFADSPARREVLANGFAVAEEMERLAL